MTVNFVWPLAVALAISSLFFMLIAGNDLLDGKPADDAVTRGGKWFLWSLFLSGFLFLVSVGVAYYVIPLRLAKIQSPRAQPRAKSKPRPVIVNGYKRGRPPTRDERRKGVLEWIGDGMRQAGQWIMPKPSPKRRNEAYTQDLRPLQVKVESREQTVQSSPEVILMENIFNVTNRMYHRCLTRPSFEAAYPTGGQAKYAEAKDWWTRLGWVDLDGRGTMSWRFQEHELYQSDRMLERIARQNGFQFPEDGGTDVVAG